MLQEADVWPASIAGLPIAVAGTAAPGTYTLLLHLTNWLNKSSVSARTVTVTGLKPMISINSNPERRIYSDQELQLVAVGTAGWCYIGGLRASGLRYLWTMTCLAGPCALVPPLDDIADSTKTRFLRVQGGRLTGSCSLLFTATVTQPTIGRSSSDSVVVHVDVRPLQVRISGASNEGLVSLSTLTVLSVKDSWDPEEATTGLHAAHGFKATWRVEEIGEQPFCSLSELRLLSLEERDKQLQQLARLLEKGTISQQEYEANRESVTWASDRLCSPTLPQVYAGCSLWDKCLGGAQKDRPDLFYPVSAPTPSIGLNTSKLMGGMRLRVTVQVTRDFDRLPAAIQLSARTQAGSRWNRSVSDNYLAVKREASLVFTVEAGPQSRCDLTILPCDPKLIPQPDACRHRSSGVDGKIANSWLAQLTSPPTLPLPSNLILVWQIERPTLAFLQPPLEKSVIQSATAATQGLQVLSSRDAALYQLTPTVLARFKSPCRYLPLIYADIC
jgi:hypothetical protein